MTPAQQSALESLVGRSLTSDEITAITASVDNRADGITAAVLSVRRKKLVPTEVGNGTILEVLGLASGNALLDAINAAPDFRHVKPMVEQGRLRLDSPLVIATLQSLVGSLLTQAQADALLARAEADAPIPASAVSEALNAVQGA